MQPLITVILPVYNGGTYLRASVDSVLKQTEHQFEFLILDDNSNDGSKDYLESLRDSRLTLYKNDINKGLFYNLNFLIKKSNTPLLKLWAQDDIMYDHCLSSFIAFHKIHPNIGFSYSGRTVIDENGDIIPIKKNDNTPTVISSELHARISFYTGSIAGNIANVCINKNALDDTGLFNESMKISADFDMWVRLAEKRETGFIKDDLIFLRDHKNQLSRNEDYYLFHVKEDIKVFRYLSGYVSPAVCREGRKLLRDNKFVFYYTLMIKTILKGKLKTGYLYYRELAAADNFILLTFSFIKRKIIGGKKPIFLNMQESKRSGS